MTFILHNPRYERKTIPQKRFWWVVRLTRLLLKFANHEQEETWQIDRERADGSREFEFYIKVIIPKK